MQVMGNPMDDREREERAVWKLDQAGYRVRKPAGSYLVTTSESVTELDDLVQLAAFADAIDANHWIGRTLTPSAELPHPKRRTFRADRRLHNRPRTSISSTSTALRVGQDQASPCQHTIPGAHPSTLVRRR